MARINGDTAVGIGQKVAYLFQCALENASVGERIPISETRLNENLVNSLIGSPSRIYSDLFWHSLDYASLAAGLDADLNVFDIGCGSGRYGKLLAELAGPCFGSYTGLDIYRHSAFPAGFEHHLDDAISAPRYFNSGTNFVMSQSALEHIEEDVSVLKSVTAALENQQSPYIQIHMIPAPASLPLYLWHGWRQYSRARIFEIKEALGSVESEIDFRVFPLGGTSSLMAHFRWITMPTILNRRFGRGADHEVDWERLRVAVEQDVRKNSISTPTFWALFISNVSISDSIFLGDPSDA